MSKKSQIAPHFLSRSTANINLSLHPSFHVGDRSEPGSLRAGWARCPRVMGTVGVVIKGDAGVWEDDVEVYHVWGHSPLE